MQVGHKTPSTYELPFSGHFNQLRYVFVLTELQGVYLLTAGSLYLGLGGLNKICTIVTGQKTKLFPSENHLQNGLLYMKLGLVKIIPATAIALATYVVQKRIFCSKI